MKGMKEYHPITPGASSRRGQGNSSVKLERACESALLVFDVELDRRRREVAAAEVESKYSPGGPERPRAGTRDTASPPYRRRSSAGRRGSPREIGSSEMPGMSAKRRPSSAVTSL